MNGNDEERIDPNLSLQEIENLRLTGVQEKSFYGQPWVRCTYKDGKLEGLYENWYENGQLAKRYVYVDGKLDGLCEWWWDNGRIMERRVYEDGRVISREYYPNFSPRMEFLKMNNLNPDGSRKEGTNMLEETKQVTTPKKKRGRKM